MAPTSFRRPIVKITPGYDCCVTFATATVSVTSVLADAASDSDVASRSFIYDIGPTGISDRILRASCYAVGTGRCCVTIKVTSGTGNDSLNSRSDCFVT